MLWKLCLISHLMDFPLFHAIRKRTSAANIAYSPPTSLRKGDSMCSIRFRHLKNPYIHVVPHRLNRPKQFWTKDLGLNLMIQANISSFNWSDTKWSSLHVWTLLFIDVQGSVYNLLGLHCTHNNSAVENLVCILLGV